MRTEYWKSRVSPRVGTKKKRHARRRGPGLTPMPTAIIPMYSNDRILVARNAATNRENMVISRPQFCTSETRVSSGKILRLLLLGCTWGFVQGLGLGLAAVTVRHDALAGRTGN